MTQEDVGVGAGPAVSSLTPERRNIGIDVLRGVAITMVMLLHYCLTYRLWAHGPLMQLFGHKAVYSVLGWGNYGVTMFFTVSGFLIASNAAERSRTGGLGGIDLRDFYVRRFARLQPVLVIALALIVGLGLAGLPSFVGKQPHATAHMLVGALSVLTFWHNVLMQSWGYFNYAMNVYWSLSVEEVFYLAFPIVCVLLRRDLLLALVCVALIGVAPAYRAAHSDNEIFFLYGNFACFDAIAIGVLASIPVRHWRPAPGLARALRWGGGIAAAVIWLRGFGGTRLIFGFTLIALATAAIILGCLTPARRARESLAERGLAWLGRHSYELYLFHIIVLGIMREIVPAKALGDGWQLPWLAVYVALSCLAAWSVARWIGDPANRRLRKLGLRRSASRGAHQASGV